MDEDSLFTDSPWKRENCPFFGFHRNVERAKLLGDFLEAPQSPSVNQHLSTEPHLRHECNDIEESNSSAQWRALKKMKWSRRTWKKRSPSSIMPWLRWWKLLTLPILPTDSLCLDKLNFVWKGWMDIPGHRAKAFVLFGDKRVRSTQCGTRKF